MNAGDLGTESEIERLSRLADHLCETLEGIRQHADAMGQPGQTPSFSKTAISHFHQLRDECDRALAYARLKRVQ